MLHKCKVPYVQVSLFYISNQIGAYTLTTNCDKVCRFLLGFTLETHNRRIWLAGVNHLELLIFPGFLFVRSANKLLLEIAVTI